MMPRIKPLLVLCAALLTVTPAASADVNSDMNQFFNKLGLPPCRHAPLTAIFCGQLWKGGPPEFITATILINA